ncbi:hypothetical protein KR018_012503 [Drosophila ironensis]|nr:hypothetical protein KR018_012503 [Drosophila ironensis]
MNNQLNPATYRKFNNLLNSGAVTVTGPTQPRILKTTRLVVPGGGVGGGGGGGGGVGGGVAASVASAGDADASSGNVSGLATRCYICDDRCDPQTSLTDMCTTHTSTKFPNKLAQLVGEGFLVIVCGEDYICSRCTNLVNYYDRLENDVERVKTNLISLLNKKYAINEDSGPGEASPPLKMQKMAAGVANRSVEESPSGELRPRKLVQGTPGRSHTPQVYPRTYSYPFCFFAGGPTKITAGGAQSGPLGSQTVQRKATKIYKCTSCDYKTSDMRLFNTHYETCKQQTFQCKTCRKIFPHFGAMKQHMVRDHNTAMDNTCAMCHINFVNETSLRKHMETNHATNVLVTSTTTIPAAAAPVAAAAAAAAAAASETMTGTALYTCNHCQYKTTDKGVFDEHLRKHAAGGKPKPFKCRLCSQRFETREAATVHAKQHQTNYFKCGTCSMTFAKRELLVKHFEVHQNQAGAGVSPKQAVSSQNPNTQKLLQETIDEALSDSVPAAGGTATVVASSEQENNIRFFSCSLCSLTFIQETYYNHHMETHRRDKKVVATGASALNSAATALLSDEPGEAPGKAGEEGGEQNAEADIESLFEKLHSDKNESGEAQKGGGKGGEMVITSQEGSGGITFNITIPQPDGDQSAKNSPNATAPVSVSIDMPVLDQAEDESQSQGSVDGKREAGEKNASAGDSKSNAAPVSMPSLDDDNEAAAAVSAAPEEAKAATKPSGEKAKGKAEESAKEKEAAAAAAEEPHPSDEVATKRNAADTATADSEAAAASAEGAESAEGEVTAGTGVEGEAGEGAAGEQQVAIELDEAMQAQVDGGQIKFIMNENGHLLQLDNHILTDAEGNQIIVQDPEQIQQLLQSVGVLQSGDGLEGETLQMMTDGSGQMVLVHGDNNEQQLIDASLLNAEGQLIIQQGQDGEEGAHVISEDGTRIPVSVSYTEDGQPIVQVQQQVLEAAQAAAAASGAASAEEKEAAVAVAAGEEVQVSEASSGAAASTTTVVATSTAGSSGGATGGNFFALEEFAEAKTD